MSSGLMPERLRDQPAAALRLLRRRPDLELPVLEHRRRVLRLERRVRDERIEVRRLDRLRRALHRAVEVAVLAQILLRRLLRQRLRLRREPFAALRRGRPLVPLHDELLSRLLDEPPVVADQRDTREKSHQPALLCLIDDERVLHAGLRLHLVEIRARRLAGEHGALHVARVQHSRHRDVDAEHRLSGHDVPHVDAGHARADDLEIFRVFQLHRREIGRGQRRRLRGELTVRRLAAALAVQHDAFGRLELGLRHVERLRRRGDKHRAPRRADLTHRHPVRRRRRAAARALRLELGRVEQRLFDANVLPRHVQLVGDDHRKHRLHALPDLRVLGDDRDDAVRRDANEVAERGLGRRRRERERFGRFTELDVRAEQNAAAGERGDAQERTPVDCRIERRGHWRLLGRLTDCRSSASRRLPPASALRGGSPAECGDRSRTDRCCRSSRRRCPRRSDSACSRGAPTPT